MTILFYLLIQMTGFFSLKTSLQLEFWPIPLMYFRVFQDKNRILESVELLV